MNLYMMRYSPDIRLKGFYRVTSRYILYYGGRKPKYPCVKLTKEDMTKLNAVDMAWLEECNQAVRKKFYDAWAKDFLKRFEAELENERGELLENLSTDVRESSGPIPGCGSGQDVRGVQENH